MRLLKPSAMMLVLLATSACATRATPPIADSACLSFKQIGYSIPPLQADGTRNVAADDGNKFDTPETIEGVSEHNARVHAICH